MKLIKTRAKNIYKEPTAGIFYVRMKRKGKPTLYKSLDTKNYKIACDEGDKAIREYLGNAQKKVLSLLFKEEVDAFLKSYAATVKPSTHKRMKTVFDKHLIPYWGLRFLKEITPGEWNTYLTDPVHKSRNLSNDKKAMSLLLHYAYGEKRLESVPTLTDPTENESIGQEFTKDEISKILKCADDERVRVAILLAYKYGPRILEVVSIGWKDINFSESYITVKGKTGRRKVAIHEPTLNVLMDMKKRSKSPWVFPQAKDLSKHLSTNGLDNLWQSCKQRAEVFKRFHDLRHTAITGWLRQGKSIVWIAKQVGNSPRQIMSVYEHLQIKDIGELGEAVKVDGEMDFFKPKKEGVEGGNGVE